MKTESIGQSLLRVARTIILTCSLCIVSGCDFGFDLFDEDKIPTCKNDCTIIKGRFLTDGGTTPIPNVTLRLVWSDPCLGCFFGSGSRNIKTTKTDNNGNYEFKFATADIELKYGYYEVIFDHPGEPFYDFEYYRYYYYSFSVPVAKGTSTIYNYLLPKSGQIQLSITNPEAIGADEYLVAESYFKYANLSEEEWGCYLSSARGTTITCDAAANQFNYLRITKKKAGVISATIDSVFVSDQRTYNYEAAF